MLVSCRFHARPRPQRWIRKKREKWKKREKQRKKQKKTEQIEMLSFHLFEAVVSCLVLRLASCLECPYWRGKGIFWRVQPYTLVIGVLPTPFIYTFPFFDFMQASWIKQNYSTRTKNKKGNIKNKLIYIFRFVFSDPVRHVVGVQLFHEAEVRRDTLRICVSYAFQSVGFQIPSVSHQGSPGIRRN